MHSGVDPDLALTRLEREYQMCLAASKPRAPEPPAPEADSDDEPAEELGYAQLGAFSDHEQEDEDEVLGVGPSGVCDEEADVTDDEDDKKTDGDDAGEDDATAQQDRHAPEGGTKTPAAESSVESEAWVADFDDASFEEERSSMDGFAAGATGPPASSATEVLPAERVAQIKEVMAGLSLAPPPPEWASAVSEDVWLGKLLGRVGTGAGPDATGGAANGSPKAPEPA